MDKDSMRIARQHYAITLAAAEATPELTDEEKAYALLDFLKNGGTQSTTAHGALAEVSEVFARAVIEKNRKALIKI